MNREILAHENWPKLKKMLEKLRSVLVAELAVVVLVGVAFVFALEHVVAPEQLSAELMQLSVAVPAVIFAVVVPVASFVAAVLAIVSAAAVLALTFVAAVLARAFAVVAFALVEEV